MSIGYNRFVRQAWMDRALEEAASGADPEAARERLDSALARDVSGAESRRETVRLLHQIWLAPRPALERLRTDAVALYRTGLDPLVLHWGMSLAAYPFFRIVAETAGRPVRLDGQASAPAMLRRVADSCGDRPTVHRAAQRVLQSTVEWGALLRKSDGTYQPGVPIVLNSEGSAWLLSALFVSLQTRSAAMETLSANPALFPFTVEHVRQLTGGVEKVRQGGFDVAMLGQESSIRRDETVHQ